MNKSKPPGNVTTRLIQMLSDGALHLDKELMTCLWDELGNYSNLKPRIHYVRKAVESEGLEVLRVLRGHQRGYQMVIPLRVNRT